MSDEARRRIPATHVLLADPDIAAAAERLGAARVKQVVTECQAAARRGELDPSAVLTEAKRRMPRSTTSLRRVINATGVVVHTNIGRAPLSEAAIEAAVAAAGTTDLELDLATGQRGRRGGAVLEALVEATGAEAALVVNNGAAAVALAATALAAGREIVVSRGEMVEIGDGFRIPELASSTGARLREVGTTNRTRAADYAAAVGPDTGCILKVHPSNFEVVGFTSAATVEQLAELGPPVVVDIGSGLLRPDPLLPDEPDAATALAAGAAIVTASGDKLLGGPQAGIVLGRADIVERLRRHPLARALRIDKLTLAALEATLTGPTPPVTRMRRLTAAELEPRTRTLAESLVTQGLSAEVVESIGRVGGGGAPGVELPGWAVALPEGYAAALRTRDPAVLARVERGRCLVDLRCVPESEDGVVRDAVLAVAAGGRSAEGAGVDAHGIPPLDA
ncbi:L-seryl-tRNA(Sec) selenium transferase [Actinomycetota bacterium]